MKRFAFGAVCAFVFAAIVFTGLVAAQGRRAAKTIQIKGSDTMVHLVTALSEVFMEKHPNVRLSITGGGSGTGIAALLNGTTDICASSRDLKDEEKALAAAKNITPVATVIGLDGLAVMVHPSNPVSELSLEQLRKIYTGEYERWSDVGGPAIPIVVLSRESNSGTYVYFQEHVLNKADFTPKARLMPSTAAITQALKEDRGGIGYGGVAYGAQGGVKILKIKATPDGEAVYPDEQAVHSGRYPISRPLFLFTNGQPSGVVQQFLQFCLSDEGQKIVVETGYMTAPRR